MKSITFTKSGISSFCFLLFMALANGNIFANDSAKLADSFVSPPAESRPWVFWRWLNGAASKEGITRDFEEMKKQGIGGALLFDSGEVDPKLQQGPPFMSDEWRELFRHSVKEAHRCGIILSVNLCSGWNAGGPWITPEHAAKTLVSSQTIVKGGDTTVAVRLAQPPAVQNFYRDIVALAMPVEDGVLAGGRLTASSQTSDGGVALAEDGNDQTSWISTGWKAGMGPTLEKPAFLQFDFAEPWAAGGCYLKPHVESGPKDVEVQCSDNGRDFRPLKRAQLERDRESVIAFDETRAKHFRLLISSAYPQGKEAASRNVRVAEFALLSKDQVALGKKNQPRGQWTHKQAVDVSRFVNQEGELTWKVPSGSWRILRIGYTLLDRLTHNPGSGPAGREVDPMSHAAMDAHFAETAAKLISDAGKLAGNTFQYLEIDSWEFPQPTWTPLMRQEFKARRGYDPLLWLPAVLGQTVDGIEESRRFLQDYRRTAADLVAANYYGRLNELAIQGGLLGTTCEAGGPYFTHWVDALQCQGKQTVPMGEFWKRNLEPDGGMNYGPHNLTVKQAASAAHIYGKPVCQAEAFTSAACDFIDDPWSMKDVGDSAFCAGLTRMVFHGFYTQLHPERKPGIFWPHIGTHFGYNLTWWPMSNAWLTYLARCQHLLQQGLFVADFAYLQDEAIPAFIARRPDQQPMRPPGFDYDALNAEVLLTRCTAENGRLTLPDGMSYRYLVLPHHSGAILADSTLKKINELAEAGITVLGPRAFADRVPKLREGALHTVVVADGLAPDLELRKPSPSANIEWIHRRSDNEDIYFLSNQGTNMASVRAVFRVQDKQPELWDPVTGSIRNLPEYQLTDDNRIEIPMQFAPRQSLFVVFKKNIKPTETSDRDGSRNFPETKPAQELAGPWEVEFDPAWFYPASGTGHKVRFDQLEDWTTCKEEAIKFYSGIATYRMTFESGSGETPSARYLDLGSVRNLARVRLNGRDLGTLWTAPWRVAIPAGLLKPTGNQLEIEVANLWPNRLIGDGFLPRNQRRTVCNVTTYEPVLSFNSGDWAQGSCPACAGRHQSGKPAEPLPSGLLGPVRILEELVP